LLAEDPARNVEHFIDVWNVFFLQKILTISIEETISDPGVLDRSPGRIDNDPEFS
jgi:hypothetical protein